MHHGLAQAVQHKRAEVLLAAFHARPERFVNSVPQPPPVPTVAWINKPATMEMLTNLRNPPSHPR